MSAPVRDSAPAPAGTPRAATGLPGMRCHPAVRPTTRRREARDSSLPDSTAGLHRSGPRRTVRLSVTRPPMKRNRVRCEDLGGYPPPRDDRLDGAWCRERLPADAAGGREEARSLAHSGRAAQAARGQRCEVLDRPASTATRLAALYPREWTMPSMNSAVIRGARLRPARSRPLGRFARGRSGRIGRDGSVRGLHAESAFEAEQVRLNMTAPIFGAFLRSLLTDSNRRPPPYHRGFGRVWDSQEIVCPRRSSCIYTISPLSSPVP
jgi:hypothetical protein